MDKISFTDWLDLHKNGEGLAHLAAQLSQITSVPGHVCESLPGKWYNSNPKLTNALKCLHQAKSEGYLLTLEDVLRPTVGRKGDK